MKRSGTCLCSMLLLLLCTGRANAADIFRYYAPPGSLALNASYEAGSQELLTFTIEHEGGPSQAGS